MMNRLLSLNGKLVLIGALCVVFLIAAMSVVYTKHINRTSFAELQSLEHKRDEMNIEWGQLALEKSMLATSSEIERLAKNKLGMDQPTDRVFISIKP